MQQKEIVISLLRERGKTQKWLSEQLGYAHTSGVNNMLQRGNVEVDTLVRIAEIFDYEVVICPKNRVHPNGEMVITK